MPHFESYAPQVTFIKRNGKKFTKTYHTRIAAVKSIKAYRNKGGKIAKTGFYTPHLEKGNPYKLRRNANHISKSHKYF